MLMEQTPRLTVRQRFAQRLYLLARRDIEWAEGLLSAVALHRALLLLFPPREFNIFAFYGPLTSRWQAVAWALFALCSVVALISGALRFRVPLLMAAAFLWMFSGVLTVWYSQSDLIAGPSFIYAAFAIGAVWRLGARRERL